MFASVGWLAEKSLCDGVPVLRDRLQLSRRVLQRHVDDAVAVECGHAPELALGDEICGLESVAGGKDAVACRGGAAALHMTQHRHARLVPGSLLDLPRERGADAPL